MAKEEISRRLFTFLRWLTAAASALFLVYSLCRGGGWSEIAVGRRRTTGSPNPQEKLLSAGAVVWIIQLAIQHRAKARRIPSPDRNE